MDAIATPDPGAQSAEPTTAAAAAAAVAPDQVTAQLLAKHSAGEKLSSAEYGKLGAWKARLKGLFGGKGGAPGQPDLARPGESLGVDPLAAGEASADGLPVVPPDPTLCETVASAALDGLDAWQGNRIESAARLAFPGDEKKVARYVARASFSAGPRKTLVSLSPAIAAELGVDPQESPVLIGVGLISLHLFNVQCLVEELREERRLKDGAGQGSKEKG